MAAKLHLAENTLALHLFLQRLEGLIDVVVTDENLHACSFCSAWFVEWLGGTGDKPSATLPRPVAEQGRKVHNGSVGAVSRAIGS